MLWGRSCQGNYPVHDYTDRSCYHNCHLLLYLETKDMCCSRIPDSCRPGRLTYLYICPNTTILIKNYIYTPQYKQLSDQRLYCFSTFIKKTAKETNGTPKFQVRGSIIEVTVKVMVLTN